ncbi:MAG: ABC transporter permease [Actinobacteria bacterium]|jgi:peptide/nickel transport system permease protein|nr:ABC transporter permease [Actinomycetota bacterium]
MTLSNYEAAQTEPANVPLTLESGKPVGLLRRGVEVFAENKLALAGVAVIVVFLLFCFIGPLIYHTDQIHTNLLDVTLRPDGAHPLGTDGSGYDQLGRLMLGGQTSLEVGIAAAVLATFFGTLWGAISGYLGGWVDAVMMRIVDGLLAIPALFLLLFLATIVTTSKTILIVVIALVSWLGTARLVRGESLSLRVREYVQAVKVMGGGGTRAVLRHIAPNAVGTIMVNATFQVADAILTVAALGYLGLSIPPPATDWGGMLSTGLQYAAVGYWWLIYPPGLAIVLVVVAFNFISDAMRDAFEVRLQRR